MRKINFKKIGLAVALLMSAFTFQSCDSDDDTNWDQVLPNALVTVKQNADACYLQLDDNTTLLAKNLKTSVFDGKEVRALVNYTATDEKSDKYSQVVHVNWIDSILTKKPAPYLSTPAENDAKYGNDEVDIVRDWVTVAEDGYLTLRFRALWGGQKPHIINLLTGVNPENPYEVELRHNQNGDAKYRLGDALVAFNLNDALPDTKGKTVKLTIRWKSSNGDKKVDFNYCSRKAITNAKQLDGYSEGRPSAPGFYHQRHGGGAGRRNSGPLRGQTGLEGWHHPLRGRSGHQIYGGCIAHSSGTAVCVPAGLFYCAGDCGGHGAEQESIKLCQRRANL